MYYYQLSKNQFSQQGLKQYDKAFLQSSQIATLVTKIAKQLFIHRNRSKTSAFAARDRG